VGLPSTLLGDGNSRLPFDQGVSLLRHVPRKRQHFERQAHHQKKLKSRSFRRTSLLGSDVSRSSCQGTILKLEYGKASKLRTDMGDGPVLCSLVATSATLAKFHTRIAVGSSSQMEPLNLYAIMLRSIHGFHWDFKSAYDSNLREPSLSSQLPVKILERATNQPSIQVSLNIF